ncbi:unnamed protein product [Cuscuta epithymum]|uniref:Uncharacterized protein n=1 Tax=Cuscuta epithymum TaxID=186058 RepID=A0AAV0DN93_9ASTE|nr:unnamed protein product [Cuscuta epithymum]
MLRSSVDGTVLRLHHVPFSQPSLTSSTASFANLVRLYYRRLSSPELPPRSKEQCHIFRCQNMSLLCKDGNDAGLQRQTASIPEIHLLEEAAAAIDASGGSRDKEAVGGGRCGVNNVKCGGSYGGYVRCGGGDLVRCGGRR